MNAAEHHPPSLEARRAADLLAEALGPAPTVGVVLGSGLGAFAGTLEGGIRLPYLAVPGFPEVAVAGHSGELVVGRLPASQTRVVALAGRVHVYEGHPIQQVVHPIRSLRLWGVEGVLLTNAAGGIRPDLAPGDLMVITDHLNLMGVNPLTGPNDGALGVRFPDLSAAYDPVFRQALLAAGEAVGVPLQTGVYGALAGPSYETPAEIRMLRALGADAVGMSTVPEVIAANHCGLRVAACSCITNLAAGLTSEALSHDEVKTVADRAREAFVAVLGEALERMAKELG